MRTAFKKSKDGNLTVLQRDPRLFIILRIKHIILLLFAVSLLISAYVYRGDLNLVMLGRIASYINPAAPKAGVLSGDPIPLDTGILNRYALIGGDIAVLNRDTLKFLNAAGGTDMETQLGYGNPAISVSGKLILCYDRGASSICAANAYKIVFKKTLSSPIITASMGDNGDFCVVTDENGYRAAVTVYNNKQKDIFLWQTSEYYIQAAAMSPSGKKMAVLVFSGSGINIISKVIIFDMTKDREVCEFQQSGESILAVHFISDTRFAAVADTKTSVYDLGSGLVNYLPYEKGSLTGFAFPGDRAALLAFGSASADQTIRLVMLDKNGKKSADAALLGELQDISASGKYLSVLTTDKVYFFNRELSKVRNPVNAGGAKEVYIRDDSTAFLIYNNRAEILS